MAAEGVFAAAAGWAVDLQTWLAILWTRRAYGSDSASVVLPSGRKD